MLTRRPDYLQSLQHENKICVEKIGSGNWYWSFASQDKKTRECALTEAQSAHDKAAAIVNELKAKAAEAQAQRDDEEDALENGESREDLMVAKSELDNEVKSLHKELAAFSDSDPTELERKKKEIELFKCHAEQFTDEIYSMEGWFKKMGTDEEELKGLRMQIYGDEVDEEDGVLKDLL